ncbi:hypothetical protein G7070_10510 [Propioniciclava coleopterorum]|uniref:Uncharacterized protein n=1 Tax=Propioniciclava coleopterorum TaxID=2714937 RepID=A0A6G7Y755_9ACTN|nr:hypothetical protein [Propioniciclava coleopterorum]QIK72620.1 hypothetical protein G7070_10510 [Propioniciclava coleopterorum]
MSDPDRTQDDEDLRKKQEDLAVEELEETEVIEEEQDGTGAIPLGPGPSDDDKS